MDAQGYVVEDVYVYQDNQSAILLERNGMKSAGKGSRHIGIKYFFITNKINDKELKVIYYQPWRWRQIFSQNYYRVRYTLHLEMRCWE